MKIYCCRCFKKIEEDVDIARSKGWFVTDTPNGDQEGISFAGYCPGCLKKNMARRLVRALDPRKP